MYRWILCFFSRLEIRNYIWYHCLWALGWFYLYDEQSGRMIHNIIHDMSWHKFMPVDMYTTQIHFLHQVYYFFSPVWRTSEKINSRLHEQLCYDLCTGTQVILAYSMSQSWYLSIGYTVSSHKHVYIIPDP